MSGGDNRLVSSASDGLQPALLQDATDWRLIGLLLECPRPGWLEEVSALGTKTGDSLLRDAARAATDASEGVYHSIFGPGGPAPPREVSYSNTIQLGQLLSELAAHYNAFGFSPFSHETLDHISVEAGFVGYLRLKEAYARSRGDDDHADLAAEAASRFIEEHLSRIAGPLAARLGQSGVEYLAVVSRALIERTGPPPEPAREDSAFNVLPASSVEDPVFDCGDDSIAGAEPVIPGMDG